MTDDILSVRNELAAAGSASERSKAVAERTATILAFPSAASSRRMRVLVVNPNRRQATAVARTLDMLGYDSATAQDVAEAAERIAHFKPDEVVWDIDAPGLLRRRAFDVLRRLLVDAAAARTSA